VPGALRALLRSREFAVAAESFNPEPPATVNAARGTDLLSMRDLPEPNSQDLRPEQHAKASGHTQTIVTLAVADGSGLNEAAEPQPLVSTIAAPDCRLPTADSLLRSRDQFVYRLAIGDELDRSAVVGVLGLVRIDAQ
jgi:hypothetical protein